MIVATSLLATALVTLAQLFAISTKTNLGSRNTTYATVLAQQKIEELRALTWGFDLQGLPISDTTSDTSVSPEQPNGGSGLAPSPKTALNENTPGYVDYIDQFGNKLGGGAQPPGNTVYMVSPDRRFVRSDSGLTVRCARTAPPIIAHSAGSRRGQDCNSGIGSSSAPAPKTHWPRRGRGQAFISRPPDSTQKRQKVHRNRRTVRNSG